jgi:hypothetical protein
MAGALADHLDTVAELPMNNVEADAAGRNIPATNAKQAPLISAITGSSESGPMR